MLRLSILTVTLFFLIFAVGLRGYDVIDHVIFNDKQQEVRKSVDTVTFGYAVAEDKAQPSSPPEPKPKKRFTGGFSDTEIEILQSLSERRKEIEKRETRLEERLVLLNAAEKQVEAKIDELNSLKSDIQDLLGQQEKEEQARLSSLVKIYETMKPKDAARIFNTLDIEILIRVMSDMSERKTAPILAEMDEERAQLVTTLLAEEIKLPEAPE